MRRAATAAYCVASLLAWLAYGPFFHAHSPGEGGEIHAHFDLEAAEHGHHESSELELPHKGHHGVEVSVFSGQLTPPVAPLPQIREVYRLVDAPILQGKVVEQPVRVHDPPARVLSSPRSPPA